MTGYWPVTPWWGKAKVSTSISFEIYNQDNAKFDFDIEEKYVIIFYPYYRAKKVITSKYQLAWNNLNSQLSVFDFAENWTGNKLKFNRVNETISNTNETASAPIKQNTVKKLEDFSVVVTYDEIINKNYSLSAGQYFEVKIDYVDITNEEFESKLKGFETSLTSLFAESKDLEKEIQSNLKSLRFDKLSLK